MCGARAKRSDSGGALRVIDRTQGDTLDQRAGQRDRKHLLRLGESNLSGSEPISKPDIIIILPDKLCIYIFLTSSQTSIQFKLFI